MRANNTQNSLDDSIDRRPSTTTSAEIIVGDLQIIPGGIRILPSVNPLGGTTTIRLLSR
jgi:hypothetical protein